MAAQATGRRVRDVAVSRFRFAQADAELSALLLDSAPDPADRQSILVDNPAELFGLPIE